MESRHFVRWAWNRFLVLIKKNNYYFVLFDIFFHRQWYPEWRLKTKLWTRSKDWKRLAWKLWGTGNIVKPPKNIVLHISPKPKILFCTYFIREFSTALETLDQALGHASGCVRLKMARGDCLAHLGRYCGLQMVLIINSPLYNISGNNCDFRYVDGAKAASSILQQDQRHVGALFLRYFEIVAQICFYNFFLQGVSAFTTRTMWSEPSLISSR